LDDARWHNVAFAPWRLARRLRVVGLELEWAGTTRTVRARRGTPVARLAGLPGELLLFLFGRRPAAEVEVRCSVEAVAAIARTRFGL
jgi:hypothetical protein